MEVDHHFRGSVWKLITIFVVLLSASRARALNRYENVEGPCSRPGRGMYNEEPGAALAFGAQRFALQHSRLCDFGVYDILFSAGAAACGVDASIAALSS